jgi:indolepyruvate ferredoxin oxidoreductase beta subunit
MKYDLIICGVGGQGILAISMVLGRACLAANLHIRQSEIHGMAQRGGSVHSHFRFSDEVICSDMIPNSKADMILAMEPMEALRYLPWLNPEGRIITNTEPVVNIPDYPELETLYQELERYPNVLMLNATEMARNARAARAVNMALLGAASAYLPLDEEILKGAIQTHFAGRASSMIEKNLEIFSQARELAHNS